MKFQLAIFAFLGLIQLSKAYDSEEDEWDEEYDNDTNQVDDIWADYDTEGERNSWLFGIPGD